jgi:hypothetical protein
MRTENMREPENKLNTSGPYVEDKVQSVEIDGDDNLWCFQRAATTEGGRR